MSWELNNKIRNILITGAGGFIGANLVISLQKKIHIYYLSRRKLKNCNNSKWLIRRLESNFDDMKNKIDLVIHCAASGVYKKESKKKIFKTNLYHSINFIKKLYGLNCKKFIILGTASEYGSFKKNPISAKKTKLNPVDNYGISKKKFFNSLKKFSKNKKDLQILYLRLFHVYGGNEPKKRLYSSLIFNCKKNKNFKLLNADQIRDFIHLDKVIIKIFNSFKKFDNKKSFFKVNNLATGKGITLKKFAIKQWKINRCQGSLIFETSKKKKTGYKIFSDTKSLL